MGTVCITCGDKPPEKNRTKCSNCRKKIQRLKVNETPIEKGTLPESPEKVVAIDSIPNYRQNTVKQQLTFCNHGYAKGFCKFSTCNK